MSRFLIWATSGKRVSKHDRPYQREAKARNLTLRQVAREAAFPRTHFIGTPERVASLIETWFQREAADGFIIHSDIPGMLEAFVDHVIPILQEKGLYRKSYPADTLRGISGWIFRSVNQTRF